VYNLIEILTEIEDEKTFNQLFNKKGKWIELNNEKDKIKNNLYDLVTTAYSFDNGHVSVPNSEAVNNLQYWEAADINDDPFADVVIFGRTSPSGIKISGIGHNGNSYSKKQVVQHLAQVLNSYGFWIEVSDRLAEVLLKRYNVPVIDNQQDVEKVLGYPIKKWLGDGWYTRVVNNENKITKEILVGKPSI